MRARERIAAFVAAYTLFAGKPLLPTTEKVKTIATVDQSDFAVQLSHKVSSVTVEPRQQVEWIAC